MTHEHVYGETREVDSETGALLRSSKDTGLVATDRRGRSLLRRQERRAFLALVAIRTEWNIVAAFVGVFHIQMLLVGERLYDVVRRLRESKR